MFGALGNDLRSPPQLTTIKLIKPLTLHSIPLKNLRASHLGKYPLTALSQRLDSGSTPLIKMVVDVTSF